MLVYLRYSGSISFYKTIEKSLQSQDFEKARQLCLKHIDNHPNDFVIKYYLGEALEGLKDFQGAILYYEKAAISASAYKNEALKNEIHLKTALLYKKMHRDKEALGYFALVLDHDPRNEKALYNCGEIYYEFKNYEKAKKLLQTNLEIKPGHIKTHYLLGEINMAMRKYPEAIENFKYIMENEKAGDEIIRTKILLNMTDAYLEIKDFTNAKNALTEFMKNENNFEEGAIKMIEVKIRAGEFDEAAEFARQNLNNLSSTYRSMALNFLGTIYFRACKYIDAIKSWEEAFALNPGSKELNSIVNRYSIIINNPVLEELFSENEDRVEDFIKKMVKKTNISNIVKKQRYWAFQAGDLFYVLYRVPQKITPAEIQEIRETVKRNFISSNNFILISLYGVEYQADNQEITRNITLLPQKDLIHMVNSE